MQICGRIHMLHMYLHAEIAEVQWFRVEKPAVMLVPDDGDPVELEGVEHPAEAGEFRTLVEIPVPSADDGSIQCLYAYTSRTAQCEWIASKARGRKYMIEGSLGRERPYARANKDQIGTK